MTKHIKYVHDKRNGFFCSLCQMSFGKRIGLKLHIEKNHRAAELKQLSQGDDLAETSANLRTPTNMKKSENDKAAY